MSEKKNLPKILPEKQRSHATMPYLPEGLIREILLRLPVKSLLRFKAVEKSWNKNISSLGFAREHQALNLSCTGNSCIVAKKDDRLSLVVDGKETVICPNSSFQLVGSVRGLVCLRHMQKFSLWNPEMRISSEFSLPPPNLEDNLDNLNVNFLCINYVGFCFNRAESDYKVVVCYKGPNTNRGKIFSFKTKAWSDVQVPDSLFAKGESHETLTVIVNDCAYWVNDVNDKQWILMNVIKFDGVVFTTLPQFRAHHIADGAANYQFVNMNNNLSVLAYERKKAACPVVGVFCLDVESGVWNPMHRVRALDFQARCMLSLSQDFRFGDELKIQNSCGYFFYDRESKQMKFGRSATLDYVVNCYTHVPTLEPVDGMNSVDSRTVNFSLKNCSRPPWRLIRSLGT